LYVSGHTENSYFRLFDEPTIKPVQIMKTFILVLALTGINVACSDDELGGVPCDSIHTTRIGAKCNDGSTSRSTGQGTCSHHDGVNYWICKD
jgi:hypothetical protein